MHRHVVNVLLVLCVSLAAGGLATLSLAARQAPQGPKTHWEPYKHKPTVPQPDQHLTDPAIIGAIDLHAHHDPDSYPRYADAFEIAKLAKERGLRGICAEESLDRDRRASRIWSASTRRQATRCLVR